MALSFCMQRHPDRDKSFVRCDRERGHDAAHEATLQGVTYRWPAKGKAKSQAKDRAPMKRGKGVKQVSIKQHYRNGFLNGVKAERLSNQLHTFGYFWCEAKCGWSTGDLEVAKKMHLHHGDTQRSMGTRATPESWGVDDPGGLVLLCPSCHGKVHEPLDGPQWTPRETEVVTPEAGML